MTATAAATASRTTAARGRPAGGRRPGTRTVAYWELVKLCSQRSQQALAAACLLGPALLAVGLTLQTGVPQDSLFGSQVRSSGYALPLVLLGAAGWLLPMLAAAAAGRVFADEDRYGMWPLLLGRSRGRGQLFAGKVLAAAAVLVALLALLAVGSLLAGIGLAGSRPLVGLSGTVLPPGRCLLLVVISWASMLPALAPYAALALFLSVVTRSPVVGVAGTLGVGLLLDVLSLLQGADVLRHLLPATVAEGWHGLFADPAFRGPLLQGGLVGAGWTCLLLVSAWTVFVRRDETGA